jgi:hypothetical protein
VLDDIWDIAKIAVICHITDLIIKNYITKTYSELAFDLTEVDEDMKDIKGDVCKELKTHSTKYIES